jgi:hypothetical protein
MTTELQRTCPSYGSEFSGAMEFCPVCMLRTAVRAPHLERAKRRLRLKFRILEESSAGRPNASISAI